MEKYIVNKEIGSGSFGKVFVVESKTTGIQYVAKQIDLSKLNKRQKSLAEKEIQVLSKLKHTNIVRYKEAFSDEKNLHIVMELCELGDLHGLIQETRVRNDRFSDAEVMDYFVQICLALEYIHQQRILHRDLKTKNIFLKKGNVIKLGDFGVAKVLENSFELARTCIGSPFYISPEMCENQPYDKKSDIWALGCVLFELATLKYAFTAKNMKTLLTKITAGEHNALPPNTNPKIRYLIKKLLHQNPKQRPTVTEVLLSPHIAEFKERLCCKVRVLPHVRCRSGEDLRQTHLIQNNLRCKSSRTELPISKSSLNLNTNDITDPQAKYKSPAKPKLRRPNFWKALCEPKSEKIVNETKENRKTSTKAKNNNAEAPKAKKLPKTDSLYYSLIEENNRAGPEKVKPVSMIRNMFEKSYHTFQNFDDEEVGAESQNYRGCEEKDKKLNLDEEKENEAAEEEKSHKDLFQFVTRGPDTDPAEEHDESKLRKRWETTTADRNQLITLLNETDLTNTFSDTSDCTVLIKEPLKRERPKSVEDLLFMETTDLSHIAVLKPQKVIPKTVTRKRSNFEETSMFHEKLNEDRPSDFFQEEEPSDRTYVLSKTDAGRNIATSFEHLEQRRIQLEATLGLPQFMEVYKMMENQMNGSPTHLDINVAQLETKARGMRLTAEHLTLVWQLVQDDSVYEQ